MEQLRTEYIDLMLVHTPVTVWNHTLCGATWQALEDLKEEGKLRAIGVSNFCVPCLECLAGASTTVPAVNQLQFHAGMAGGDDPKGLFSYCKAKGIQPQAYSPLGGEQAATVLESPVLHAVGAAHNKSTAKVALQWVLKLGYALTTASFSEAHMKDDLDLFGWEMTAEEVARAIHGATDLIRDIALEMVDQR